jgi:hypothetical protein
MKKPNLGLGKSRHLEIRNVLVGEIRQRFRAFLRLIWGAVWKKGHFEQRVLKVTFSTEITLRTNPFLLRVTPM